MWNRDYTWQCSSSICRDAGQCSARKSTEIHHRHPRHGSSLHRRGDQVLRGLIPLPLLPKEEAQMFQRLGIPNPRLNREGGGQSTRFRKSMTVTDRRAREGRRGAGYLSGLRLPAAAGSSATLCARSSVMGARRRVGSRMNQGKETGTAVSRGGRLGR